MAKKKKWSKEECEARYIQGEESIGLRTLAKLSGRSLSVLGRWASQGQWSQKREQYENDLRTATREKTIEKTSDRLSDEWAKINEEHLKGSALFRKLSVQLTMAVAGEFNQTEKKLGLATDKHIYLAIQKYGSVYKDMVNLERQALGMEYMDSNKAIAKVLSDGYDVIEPVDED